MNRIKIAIQKSGRLHDESLQLLVRCGLTIRYSKDSLFCQCENLPIDLLLVRDDDIPTLVQDDVCDLGIVGENVLQEKLSLQESDVHVLKKLNYGFCRLAIAVPKETNDQVMSFLNGKRIATSYPNILQRYLSENKMNATIIYLSGSVEVAPRMGVAEAICDLVSTGQTLSANNLKPVADVLNSQAVLICKNNAVKASHIVELLLRRLEGVLRVKDSKYIMFHAPLKKLAEIKKLLPGAETPSVMPLDQQEDKVAIHVVCHEGVFWETLERLKSVGASSLLVMPIEKMLL